MILSYLIGSNSENLGDCVIFTHVKVCLDMCYIVYVLFHTKTIERILMTLVFSKLTY